MLPGRKRARTTAGGRSAAQRAAIGAYYARKYPYSDFGRMYVPKGYDTAAIGRSYRSATAAQRAMRKKLNYHGVGMYTGGGMYTGNGGFWKTLKKYGKKAWHSGLGKRLRSFAADELAMAAGGFVPGAGGPVRDALRKAGLGMYTGGGMYTGSGGYQQVANDLIAGGHETEGIMRFDVQNDEDCIIISHSEYVADIYAPPADTRVQTLKLPLNVGQAKTFPMLSQIAANFEDFQLVQLGFTYKPSLSDWQTTNGQVGQVLIATNYNPEAPVWTTKQQLLAQTGSTSARTIDSTLHGVECDPSKTHNDGHYLVRTGPPRPDEDLNDYDHGWTQITVVDTPKDYPNITLGELHVSYTVKLSKPRIWQSVGNIIPRWLLEDWRIGPNDPIAADMLAAEESNVQTTRHTFKEEQIEQFLVAKQNSIEARFVFANLPQAGENTQKSAAILLPANMAGDFRLNFQIHTTAAVRAQVIHAFAGQFRNLENTSSGNNAPKFGPQELTAGDNFDNTWYKTLAQPFAVDEPVYRHIGYIDFHVDVARDGIDNMLYLSMVDEEPELQVSYIRLDLVALNTTLQWRQDGTNDTNIMVDKNDQIVTF